MSMHFTSKCYTTEDGASIGASLKCSDFLNFGSNICVVSSCHCSEANIQWQKCVHITIYCIDAVNQISSMKVEKSVLTFKVNKNKHIFVQ
jgi:hypothetical protein